MFDAKEQQEMMRYPHAIPHLICMFVSVAALLSGFSSALALPDDAAPERAWFVKLKTDLGKKANLGHFGEFETKPGLWFENRNSPKQKHQVFAPPQPFLEHTACANTPPDPAKALGAEEGWWLFDSFIYPPVALQLSFDGAAFWRYSAEQKCLVRWQAPEREGCKYGGEVIGAGVAHRHPFAEMGIKTISLKGCASSPEKLQEVSASFTTESYLKYTEEWAAKPDEALETSLGVDFKMISLPALSKKGERKDTPLLMFIGHAGGFYISPPITEENPAPDPIFSYDQIKFPEEDYDDQMHFSASLWRMTDDTIALQLERWNTHAETSLPRSEEGDATTEYVVNMYLWNPSKKQFAFAWKFSEEAYFLTPDADNNATRQGRELRTYNSYPLSPDSTIAYRFKLSATDNLKEECYEDEYGEGGCTSVIKSTRHSREIQWTININGHDLELLTIKPKAITE